MKELAESREDKEARSKHVQEEREAALKQMGIALKEDGGKAHELRSLRPVPVEFLPRSVAGAHANTKRFFCRLFLGHLGVTQQKQPHLLNLNEDPLMSELLLYYLSTEGVTK